MTYTPFVQNRPSHRDAKTIFWLFQPILSLWMYKNIKLAITVYLFIIAVEDLSGPAYITDHFVEMAKDLSDWLEHGRPHKPPKSGKICLCNTELLSYPMENNLAFVRMHPTISMDMFIYYLAGVCVVRWTNFSFILVAVILT